MDFQLYIKHLDVFDCGLQLDEKTDILFDKMLLHYRVNHHRSEFVLHGYLA